MILNTWNVGCNSIKAISRSKVLSLVVTHENIKSFRQHNAQQLLDNIPIHHMLVPNLYLFYTSLPLYETSPSVIFLQI